MAGGGSGRGGGGLKNLFAAESATLRLRVCVRLCQRLSEHKFALTDGGGTMLERKAPRAKWSQRRPRQAESGSTKYKSFLLGQPACYCIRRWFVWLTRQVLRARYGRFLMLENCFQIAIVSVRRAKLSCDMNQWSAGKRAQSRFF